MSEEEKPITKEESKEDIYREMDLSPEEVAYIENSPSMPHLPSQQHNVHEFLFNVAKAKDTTKLGYLKEEELGTPKLPLRTLKELSVFSNLVADMPYFAEYFLQKGEILTSTSLSKDAKLLDSAVVTRREVADISKKPRKENKGWFKKKNNEESDES